MAVLCAVTTEPRAEAELSDGLRAAEWSKTEGKEGRKH
jgi:hypothetical protein